MKYSIALLTLGLLFTLNIHSEATPYQIPGNFYDVAPSATILVVDDPGDTNDAYAAVSEWGQEYALTSIQGTHSWVDAKAGYYSGFKVQGASNVEVDLNYTLMAELTSFHQAMVTSQAMIAIYEFHAYDGFPGVVRLTNGLPIWMDTISFETGPEPLDQPYVFSSAKLDATKLLTLQSRWDWGEVYYLIEAHAWSRGLDTYHIQYQAGEYENPDAWYSAAAYADPILTVLTEGASLTELVLSEGSFSLAGGGLDAPPILRPDTTGASPVPEPSTFLLFGGGLAGLAFYARRRRKE